MVGEQFKGTWESGTESTFVLEQRESEPDYTVIDWQISASYAEYEESGRYTGNYDVYYNNIDMPYTESSWAARQPTTLADILDDMGIQYDRIVVVSEDVETPNDWQYNVNGEYILTGDEIEIIELSAHWAGRRY